MYLIDANVLIYAVNESAARHLVARTWMDRALSEREAVGFAWTAMLAFLRLTTHPAVFARPLSAGEAADSLRAWLAQPPAVVVEPTPRHLDVLAGLLAESGSAGNLVSDAHLAALAIEHDATLVSFDTDFSRFSGLRLQQPT